MPLTDSWYRASTETPVYSPLRGRQQADVCVIGGGYTGLSAALELAEAGRRVIVLEAEQPGWGCSGRNGGQINPGLACDHGLLEQQLGRADALRMWQLSLQGVQLIQQRAERYRIDCDLRSGILLVANRPRQVPELRAWQQQLEALGYDRLSFHDRGELNQLLRADYQAGVMDSGGGSLHPLKYATGLARAAAQAGALIHGQSRVSAIGQDATGVSVSTALGQVRADQLIIGGNAYSGELLPWQRRRFLPIGSYIGATRPLGDLAGQLIPSRAAVCDMNNLIDYYRLTPDNRLLFGGRATAGAARLTKLRQTLRQRMAGVFPQLADEDFDYLWGGQVAMTVSRAPHFGRLGNRVLYAQGYSGQGVALAGLAGKLMAEAVLGRSEGFDLFARLRHLPVPPGTRLQTAIRALALGWYALLDRRG
ncbi:MAG: FAD-binding oxidoreductase [Pseudomonas formosensis]|nr:FAD-binding oxidoreductase [Halopseudomonas formosensis]